MKKIIAVLVIVGLLLVALWYFGILQDILIKLGLMKPPEKIVITSSGYALNLMEGVTYVVNLTKESSEAMGWGGRWVVKPYVKYMLMYNMAKHVPVFYSIDFTMGDKVVSVFLDFPGTYVINFTIIEKFERRIYFEIKHLDTGYEARFTIYPDRLAGSWSEVLGNEASEVNYKLCEIHHEPKYILERRCNCEEFVNDELVCCGYEIRKLRPVVVQVSKGEGEKYALLVDVETGDYSVFKLIKIQEYVKPS